MQVCIKDWFFQFFPCERFFLNPLILSENLYFVKFEIFEYANVRYCFCTRFSTFFQFLVLLKLFNTNRTQHPFYCIIFFSCLGKFWSFIAFLQSCVFWSINRSKNKCFRKCLLKKPAHALYRLIWIKCLFLKNVYFFNLNILKLPA